MAKKRPGDTTGIEWTHLPGYRGATWNPSTGCTRVSPGCDNCYAFHLHDQRYVSNLKAAREAFPALVDHLTGNEIIAKARAAMTGILPCPIQYDLPFSTVQMLGDMRLEEPLRDRSPRAYFVDSMADLFHEAVPDEFLDRVYQVMEEASRHIFMILTKRPERMRNYVKARYERVDLFDGAPLGTKQPPANIWHGTSTEDQERLEERAGWLNDTPSAVRFLSCEPLLGPLSLVDYLPTECLGSDDGAHTDDCGHAAWPAVDWVICGGESGANFRPMDDDWARSIRDQCAAVGVPFFYKQRSHRLNGRPGPDDLNSLKQFPEVAP